MALLRLLPICFLLWVLVPTPVAATPATQSVECEFAVYASKVPGLSNHYHLFATDREVTIDGQTLTLRICAPRDQDLTADGMLDFLAQALPLLHAHAGLRLEGASSRKIVMVDNLPYFIDGMVDSRGTMHLKRNSFDWTVVHEGAHYWANSDNFAETWMIEGYAEYLTEQVMIDLGRPERVDPAPAFCDGVPLLNWNYEPLGTVECGYTAGAAIFQQLAQAVGPERLRAVLYHLTDGGGLVTSWKLLVELEQDLSLDLTPIMQPVFPADGSYDLAQRSELRRRLRLAHDLSATLGVELSPSIAPAIDVQNYAYARSTLDALLPLLEIARTIEDQCRQANLTCVQPWQPLPTDPLEQASLVDRLHQVNTEVLVRYTALDAQARAAGVPMPVSLSAPVAGLDLAAAGPIARARQVWDQGRRLEHNCQEAGITCPDHWREQWAAGDWAAAEAAIAEARLHLDFIAEQLQVVEQLCAEQEITCRVDPWQSEQLPALRERLEVFGAIHMRCEAAGWPCAAGLLQSLYGDGPAAFEAQADAVAAATEPLTVMEETIRAQTAGTTLLDRLFLFNFDADRAIAPARQAFAQGDTTLALTLLEEATTRVEWRMIWLPRLILLMLMATLLTVIIWGGLNFARYTRRRRSPAAPADDDAFLDCLLSQSPAESSGH